MLAQLVEQYGYYAVLLGSLLEGETVLLLAGIAASKGLLLYAWIVALAFIGGTLGDQFIFQLGRKFGRRMLDASPKLQAKSAPVNKMIERHQNALIVGVRFMYGLRLVGPFFIGMSEVGTTRFALLNMVGAAIWAPLVVGVGFIFAETLSWLIDDVGRIEAAALVVVLMAAGAVVIVRKRRAVTSGG